MGNVYMEAEQVRFKGDYRNAQEAIEAALEGSSGVAAEDVTYDNTESGLTADNVQEAIDELKSDIPASLAAEDIAYDNAESGLTADDVQAAIDDLVSIMGCVYTETEKVFGSWGDDTSYSRLFVFENEVTINAGSWFDTNIDSSSMDKIVAVYAVDNDGTYFPLCASTGTGHVLLAHFRTNTVGVKELALVYTKTA